MKLLANDVGSYGDERWNYSISRNHGFWIPSCAVIQDTMVVLVKSIGRNYVFVVQLCTKSCDYCDSS